MHLAHFIAGLHHNFIKRIIPAIKYFYVSCTKSHEYPDDLRTILYLKYTGIRGISEIQCSLSTRLFAGMFMSARLYSIIHAGYSRLLRICRSIPLPVDHFVPLKKILVCRTGTKKYRNLNLALAGS